MGIQNVIFYRKKNYILKSIELNYLYCTLNIKFKKNNKCMLN